MNKIPEWEDLMIDLKTMGRPPCGAIVAIGAAFFSVPRLSIGPTFYKVIHLGSAVAAGGTLDTSTIMWWLRQSQAAQRAITFNAEHIRGVLDDFRAFINQHSGEKNVRPWGNGAGFDLTILKSAYMAQGWEEPWGYSKERCFRTVRNMFPAIEYKADGTFEGTEHNARDDAIHQAQHMIKIRRAKNGS